VARPAQAPTTTVHKPDDYQPHLDEQERAFLEIAKDCEYTLPQNLVNWRRYFLTQRSYLKEAEMWLIAKMEC
jgi:hypothetical protein